MMTLLLVFTSEIYIVLNSPITRLSDGGAVGLMAIETKFI